MMPVPAVGTAPLTASSRSVSYRSNLQATVSMLEFDAVSQSVSSSESAARCGGSSAVEAVLAGLVSFDLVVAL